MKHLLRLLIFMCVVTVHAQTPTLHLADSLYMRGNYTKAIEAYKNHENQDEVYDKIAKAYIALGNYDAALINYEHSLKTDQKNAIILFDYGKLLTRVKKHKEALEVFYKLIDIDYRNPNYHYESGLVMQKLGDSTSQNRFRTAFDLDSTHQKAIFQIAKYHLAKGQHKLVDKYTDVGLSSYANNKELISLKAQNFYKKKDYENAAIWFEKLVALNESLKFIHEKLRNCYMLQYEFEKAIEHGKKVLEFDSQNTENLFIQGELYQRIEDFKNAEKYMSQSLILQDIVLDEEYIKLAGVYSRQKKYKESIDTYKKAIAENPKNERAHFLSIYVKDQYYKDIDTRINLYEAFNKKFPKNLYKAITNRRIEELKNEKFMKTD